MDDITRLFYRSGAGGGTQLMVAGLVLQPRPSVTARRALFAVSDIATAEPHRHYDVSPDGSTFAMVRFDPSTHIMVIQDLPALVERRAASR